MKNIGTILAAVFLAVVLLLYMCTFQVRFTEVAIKKTWGKPATEAITEPALYFKWPAPVQTVVLYDKRIRILEDRTEETRTSDKKNVLLTTYTLWRIADPARFHTNFPEGVEDAAREDTCTATPDSCFDDVPGDGFVHHGLDAVAQMSQPWHPDHGSPVARPRLAAGLQPILRLWDGRVKQAADRPAEELAIIWEEVRRDPGSAPSAELLQL